MITTSITGAANASRERPVTVSVIYMVAAG